MPARTPRKPPPPASPAGPAGAPDDLTDSDRDALLRWRLALGPEAERVDPRLSLGGLGGAAPAIDVDARRLGDLDKALSFIYDERAGGLGGSRPYVPEWLSAVREFFSHEVVALVQKDAIERKGLTQLLFEPETLPFLEKNIELVATLMSAKGLIPDAARDTARQIVREVVEEVRRALEAEVRTAVLGALRRNTTSPLRVLRNLDWKRTIRKNLKGWDAERRRLVPDKLYFWANQTRRHEWDVAILVDQSGSMGESVVYSSIMAAIFASLDVLRTRLLFFDTEVVDVTPMLVDPVDVLFTAQLGGGTDINRAVAYAQANFIERPEKTLLILITDLFEGGNAEELVARMRQLADSKVKSICLLALSDGGKPSYDHEMAQKLAALGTPCFGCTPKLLVKVVERLMRGQDLGPLLGADAR
ncbi:VWA domain-containing protein [Sorangium sp. So ce176]|uniref:VWA domain-containing protein n=1 Tax=Sorangium sp. So ce176 TaxID=3133286 RepID=UPI003F5F41B8